MTAADSVLARKLRRGGVARSPLPESDFVGQIFARQIEKALRGLVKTTVSAMILDSRVVKISEALQNVSVPAMLGLVEIESGKTQGLLSFDTEMAYHLIDLMLGGDPSLAPVSITRSFTDIDMALCRFPQDAVMAAFAEALGVTFGRPLTKKIGVVAQRQDITQVRFSADNVDVLIYSVTLDIGAAARQGHIQLLLPLAMLDIICTVMKDEDDVVELEEELPSDFWRARMRRAAATAPVVVDAVLHRKKMPISAVQALKAGMLLTIPSSAPNEVNLVIGQSGKQSLVALGQLGVFEGSKVVKLSTPIDDRINDQVRRVL